MASDILLAIGGLGLFLLGMLVMTEGLRGLAGSSLRRLLARFTRSPASGALAGATTTALIQSSSATVVTAIGFVGAGLLTFPQALGVIFGANVGTTVTGWLVALVGFKLKLGTLVLPLLLLGVLLRLFGTDRLKHVGWGIAGFSLLFLGIDAMQSGMANFQGLVTPQDFPDDSIFGRLQLVLIGVAMTVITQSSSAGVATALVALGAGAISFPQAAALVIGMDVGTTCTAALATVGGSRAARQTGWSHIVYNLLSAAMAFVLLGPYSALVQDWVEGGGPGDAQLALVAFHTAFNLLGVLLILPFAGAFARLILWIVPERAPPLVRRLDERLLSDSAMAIEAAFATLRAINEALSAHLARVLAREGDAGTVGGPDPAIGQALAASAAYLEKVGRGPQEAEQQRDLAAALHALDHLQRLYHRLGQKERIETLRGDRRLTRLAALLRGLILEMQPLPDDGVGERRLDRLRQLLRRRRHPYRWLTVADAVRQDVRAEGALERLDAMRWLHRVSYHLWRIRHHLDRPSPLAGR